MITNIKFLFIFGLLLLATSSSLTFGDVQPHNDHAAAAAATVATTTGLRKTVQKLKSESSSRKDAWMEQSYEFSQTKANVLEQHRKAKVMESNQIKEAKPGNKTSKNSRLVPNATAWGCFSV
jgi:hypothetical protein